MIDEFTSLSTAKNSSEWEEKTHYRAPYKPILLLVILDLLEEGHVEQNFFEWNEELQNRFHSYLDKIYPDKTPKSFYPFYHLNSEPFWELVPVPGKEDELGAKSSIRSKNEMNQFVKGAKFKDEYFEKLSDSNFRQKLRDTILGTYFDEVVANILQKENDTNYWIEMTFADREQRQSGPRQFGEVLWAPQTKKNGSNFAAYGNLERVEPCDVIIHLDKSDNQLVGTSKVAGECQEKPCLEGSQWDQQGIAEMDYEPGERPGYYVELEEFEQFDKPIDVNDVLNDRYETRLNNILEGDEHVVFNKNFNLNQGAYLTKAPKELVALIQEVADEQEVDLPHVQLSKEDLPQISEDQDVDYDAADPETLADVVGDFATKLKDANIHFGSDHRSFVRSFVVSLATKQFVILTGLSGSGKTQLAKQFGQWFGEDRYKVVPVRPDWTDPEALFGYPDALQETKDGRKAWHVPEPLEFMLKARDNPKKPHLLLLDEMNLAHVERYFADVVSGIESDEPCLPNLVQDDGHWRIASENEQKVALPDNLFLAGTVNVDETTYMFSPKILDRANTIEFRVGSEDLRSSLEKPVDCAQGENSLVSSFLGVAARDDWNDELSEGDKNQLIEYLQTLHRGLDEGFSFGHRVVYEMMEFYSLYLGAGGNGLKEALDIQVLQKVLPRLHGSRRRLEGVLKTAGRFCWDLSTDDAESFELLDSEKDPEDAELPASFDKLKRMMKRLHQNQFVSFTE